jgi:hypothetical protein
MSKFKLGSVVTDSKGTKYVVAAHSDYEDDVKVIPFTKSLSGEHGYNYNYIYEGDLTPVKGEKFKVATARADGYTFFAMASGKTKFYGAGCRLFTSKKDYKRHWSNGPEGYHRQDYYGPAEMKAYGRDKANIKRLAVMKKVVAKLEEKI